MRMEIKTGINPNLKAGADTKDHQHNLLFDQIKNLNISIMAGDKPRVFGPLLDNLLDYVFQHFETEEEYFKKHPDYNRHCQKNYRMLKKLHTFVTELKNNMEENLEASTFLDDWFQEHIEQHALIFLANETLPLSEKKPLGQVNTLSAFKEKRSDKRVHHKDVVDGGISVQCYNVTQQKDGTAKIINMSKGGLMLITSDSVHKIDDVLIIACKIGANFKMREKVRVRRADDKLYGVKFLSPSPETLQFFTELCGAIHMGKKTHRL